jgi:hypothetical protein
MDCGRMNMTADTSRIERRRALAQRISAVLLVLGGVVVVGYLLFVPGRAADSALTPLGQRLSFVFTRPLVMMVLGILVAWLTYKSLIVDPGSLLERCASATWGVGGALCYPDATRQMGLVVFLGGLTVSVVALVLAARNDPGVFTRTL